MVVDHIGIVVESLEKGIEYWQSVFGYQQKTEIVLNTRQRVKVVFLKKQNSVDIKLIEPADDASSVSVFAKRGGGLHHLCFKCQNLKEKLRELKNLGLRVIAPPQPGEAFDNADIAFLYARNGLNVELIDTDTRAKILECRTYSLPDNSD